MCIKHVCHSIKTPRPVSKPFRFERSEQVLGMAEAAEQEPRNARTALQAAEDAVIAGWKTIRGLEDRAAKGKIILRESPGIDRQAIINNSELLQHAVTHYGILVYILCKHHSVG